MRRVALSLYLFVFLAVQLVPLDLPPRGPGQGLALHILLYLVLGLLVIVEQVKVQSAQVLGVQNISKRRHSASPRARKESPKRRLYWR